MPMFLVLTDDIQAVTDKLLLFVAIKTNEAEAKHTK
jgi:hypothetical protein